MRLYHKDVGEYFVNLVNETIKDMENRNEGFRCFVDGYLIEHTINGKIGDEELFWSSNFNNSNYDLINLITSMKGVIKVSNRVLNFPASFSIAGDGIIRQRYDDIFVYDNCEIHGKTDISYITFMENGTLRCKMDVVTYPEKDQCNPNNVVYIDGVLKENYHRRVGV